jgi:hypothetical protein
MKPMRLIPILSVTAACALSAAPAASAATSDVQQASSENWSGYVAGASSGSSRRFSNVSGSWVAPTAKCASGQGYAAFWVGLGGSGQTQALEQAGTESDCSSDGTANYFAWYELVPSAPVKLDLAISPGDQITSRVAVSGTSVTISVSDQSTGQSATRNLQMSNPDTSSAEWIAEAPSSCDQTAGNCSPLPLTDFGTVNFTGASATATDGHTGTISDLDWSAAAVALSPGASSGGPQFASAASLAGATPSSLSTDGSSFSVTWAGPGATTTSSTGGQGYGYGSGSGGYGGDGYSIGSGGYAYGGDGYDYGSGGYGYGPGGYGYAYGGDPYGGTTAYSY